MAEQQPPHGMTPEQLRQWASLINGAEDMSRFVQEGHVELTPEAVENLFVNGRRVTLSGTFNDTPPTRQERIRSYYAGWARAHRN